METYVYWQTITSMENRVDGKKDAPLRVLRIEQRKDRCNYKNGELS